MERSSCSKRQLVIYVACCLISLLDVSITVTFSTLFIYLLEEFGESRATTATVHSMLTGVTTCSCVLSGILIKWLGATRVSFAGSVLFSGGFICSFFARSILLLDVLICFVSGLGASFLYVSSAVVTRNIFEGPRRELALCGLTVCLGVGNVVYPYFLKHLAEKYGVNGTFLIIGGLYLNNFAISFLFGTLDKLKLHDQNQKPTTETAEDGKVNTQYNTLALREANICPMLSLVWKRIASLLHIRYIVVIFATAFVMASINGYLVVFEDIFTWRKFSAGEILNLFIVFCIAMLVGSVSPIVFNKAKQGADIIVLLALLSLSGCIGQLLVLFSNQLAVAVAGNFFSGVAQGGTISAGSVAVASITTDKMFSVAYGTLLSVIGILTIGFGPLYGYIWDSLQSYELAIILAAVLNGMAAVLSTISKLYSLWHSRSERRRISAQKSCSESPKF